MPVECRQRRPKKLDKVLKLCARKVFEAGSDMTSSLEKIIFMQLIFCLSGRVFQNVIAIIQFFTVNVWIEIRE